MNLHDNDAWCDDLYERVQQMNTDQLLTLWKWILLEWARKTAVQLKTRGIRG